MYDLHPFFSISLWGAFCGVLFCLNVSANFLIACSLSALMDANADVWDGLEMVSIRSSTTLVSASLLDIPAILLCSGGIKLCV